MPKPLLWYLLCGVAGLLAIIVYRTWRDGPKAGRLILLLILDAPIATAGLMFFWPVALPIVFMMARDVDEVRDGRPRRSREVDGLRAERAHLHGMIVEAVTDLKPGGKILVAGEKRDAFSRRGFVAAGAQVEIVGSDDLRLEVVGIGDEDEEEKAEG